MGVVYHAIDPNIGRPVAIKTIQFSGVRNQEEQERLRERLFREARSAGMLSHPGIVTIYDVEQQGDLAYIAMEYVDGPTLDQLLSEPTAMTPEQMYSVLGQTAVALDYAHSKGIVHRDIKPANIMIASDGTAKIADFGIAKITASGNLTMTGNIVGTPHYMSPEQVQGKAVDGRSDQFSLAVIAYEMLTGEKPYSGEHLTTVVYKIVAEEPVAPRRLNPGLSPAIETALRKAMDKRPEARYRTCQEFTAALEAAGASSKDWKLMPRGGSLNEPTVVDAPKPAVALPPARRAARGGDTTATVPKSRRSGFVPFLVGILFVAVLLIVVGKLISWKTYRPPAARTEDTDSDEPKQVKEQTAPAPPAAAPQTPAPQTPAPQTSAADKPSPLGPAAGQPSTPPAAEPEQAPATPPVSEAAKPKVEPPRVSEAAPVRVPLPKPPPPEQTESAPRRSPVRNAPSPVNVLITSSPGGATATLDGDPAAACITPCSLIAASGNHTIAVTMPGYQIEHRYLVVGSSPLELPPVVLRAVGGTLMLTSDPPGAAILVNGRRLVQVTPAQIPLSSGTYNITVEKDGRQISEKVEIRNGINYRKILLGQ